MQKQVNFFERHVQWFAVGLGALFLLFMIFQYVVSSPITVTVAGKELSPGEVDEVTLAGPVEELKRAIANPQIPPINQPDYVPEFLATIHGTKQEYPLLASTWTSGRPMGGKAGPGPVENREPPIAALPKLPPAKPVKHSNGRTTVTWADPKWNPEKARPNEEQPMLEADKDWVSLAFVINGEALNKAFEEAFNAAKILEAELDPYEFMATALVDVELVRQQVLGGGKFGKEGVIKPLPISPRLENPFPREIADADKLPPADRKKRDELVNTYLAWASENSQEFFAPAFYEWKAGEQYKTPAEAPKAELAIDRTAGRKKRLEVEERKRQAELTRRQKAAEERKAARGARGGGGGGAGAGAMPNAMPRGGPGGGGGGAMAMPPGMGQGGGGRGGPGLAMPPGMGQGAGAMPGGAKAGGGGGDVNPFNNIGPELFNVAEVGDIQIVAHDDTVQPGKTYRYKLRYRIRNPVYKQASAAKPELIKAFSIAAPDGGWSKPVTIRAQVEFYLAEVKNEKGAFDVFEWRKGRTQKSRIQVGAGDAIGNTGWSVVDIRGTGQKAYALLMDSTGSVDRHDPEKTPSDRYQELLDEADGGEVADSQ